ncbi:MAG: 2OG-Fe(II) oxygenase [Acidobacteria bacterium]|nr:2OG-Fe(II) oxygenase [Acidobacteriota bacterium]
MDRSGWHRTTRPTERKSSTEDLSTFGPLTRRVCAELNGGRFLAFLEKLTGITGLIADPHLRGGGLHEIERGGLLGVHADFNYYERLNLWRRLNLLVYLNADWDEAWGGHLELWDRDGRACVTRIAPLFNRAVLFDTSNFSYHGHPHPLNVPEGGSRKSLALYYYTVDYPYSSDNKPHSTVFVDAATLDK